MLFYYEVDQDTVNYMSLVYMFVYVPFILPASYFIMRYGLLYAMLFSTVLNAACALLQRICHDNKSKHFSCRYEIIHQWT